MRHHEESTEAVGFLKSPQRVAVTLRAHPIFCLRPFYNLPADLDCPFRRLLSQPVGAGGRDFKSHQVSQVLLSLRFWHSIEKIEEPRDSREARVRIFGA